MADELRMPLITLWLLLSCISMVACGPVLTKSTMTEIEGEAAAELAAPTAPQESLSRVDRPLQPALDINVVVFDIAPEAGETAQYMAVRKLESRLLPGLFREVLVSSNQWGVVRVVPTASALAPVNIRTVILASDGRDLALDVTVSDVTGEEWFRLRLVHR
ncbi:MAG: hypothetical protein ACO3LD_05275, partial [Luminiphilus sp.]